MGLICKACKIEEIYGIEICQPSACSIGMYQTCLHEGKVFKIGNWNIFRYLLQNVHNFMTQLCISWTHSLWWLISTSFDYKMLPFDETRSKHCHCSLGLEINIKNMAIIWTVNQLLHLKIWNYTMIIFNTIFGQFELYYLEKF